MTIQLYTEWLNEVFNKRHGAMLNQSSLLVDQARSQRREGKKTKNVTTVFIT